MRRRQGQPANVARVQPFKQGDVTKAVKGVVEAGVKVGRVEIARKGFVTLARARELAGQARAQLAEGINPKGARKPSLAMFGA